MIEGFIGYLALLLMLTCGTVAAWLAGVPIQQSTWVFLAVNWGASAPLIVALLLFIWGLWASDKKQGL